jgi:hypothetical protein
MDRIGPLAAEAEMALSSLWSALGIAEAERAALRASVGADVAALLDAKVATQAARKAAVEGDIAHLRTTISNMQTAMEERIAVVRPLAPVRANPAGGELLAGGYGLYDGLARRIPLVFIDCYYLGLHGTVGTERRCLLGPSQQLARGARRCAPAGSARSGAERRLFQPRTSSVFEI